MPGWTDAPPAEAYSAQQHASAPAAGLGQAAAATQPWAAPQPWTAGMEAAPAVWAEGTHAGLEAQHAAPATLAAAPLPPQQAGPTAASQAVAGSFAASALLRAERQQQVQGPPSQGEGDEPQHPLTVTVSAVAAGWAPDRSGRAPTGSGPCSVPVVSHPAAFAVATAPGLASFIWALCARQGSGALFRSCCGAHWQCKQGCLHADARPAACLRAMRLAWTPDAPLLPPARSCNA